jgi:hypothetical protein
VSRWPLIVTALVLVASAPAAWSLAADMLDARRERRALAERESRTLAAASELAALRARLPDWAARARAAEGFGARFTAALAEAGLAPSVLASLSADGETLVEGGELAGLPLRPVHRRASVVLSGLTLPQVGALLNAWRTREPAWTVASIDLAPAGTLSAGSPIYATGGDLPLRCVLRFEILTLAQSEGAR